MHLGDPAAEPGIMLHLAEHIGQKEHLAIAAAGDERVLGIARVLDDKPGVFDVFLRAFAAHALQIGLPALSVRGIGEHEVEGVGTELIVGQGRERGAADDIIGGVAIALEQEVGLANGVGLATDFLPVEVGGDLFAMFFGNLLEGFLGDGEHPARAAGAIIKQIGTRLDLVGHRKKHQAGHEPHGVAGCPVFAGFGVIFFIELAHQVFKDGAHGMIIQTGQIADWAGTEVDVFVQKLLDQLAEAIGFGEFGDLIPELEVFDDVLDVGRKAVEVSQKVVFEGLPGLSGLQVTEGKGGGVVERLFGCRAQGSVLIGDFCPIECGFHVEDVLLGRLQHGIEAPQHGHGQDDVAIFARTKTSRRTSSAMFQMKSVIQESWGWSIDELFKSEQVSIGLGGEIHPKSVR